MDGRDPNDNEAKAIFLAALKSNSPEERDAYIDQACRKDSRLRDEVTELFKGHESSHDDPTLVDDDENDAPNPSAEVGSAGSFAPGTLLANRYRIVSLLGRGAMGQVYRADDLKLDQSVALKFLPETRDSAQDQFLWKTLTNELVQARKVTHRHVTRVYHIGEAQGLRFMSMEYIRGEDLKTHLKRMGRLRAGKALELGRQLCSGLQAAHEEGLLHLDLKPANLMIDDRGQLKITDFGLARLSSDAEMQNRRAGTPAYMAPEQLRRGEDSKQSDLYSTGLILYEMFTGVGVHRGRSLDEILSWHASSATP